MKIILCLFTLLLLSGCASLSTPMHNATTNHTFNCEAFGFGLIGAPAAFVIREGCISDAEKKGYKQMK